jgi:hypothetical protein
MQSYAEFPELAHVYLEDSYVLEIRETEASVTFVLDAVLTPGHPGWAEPGPD